MQAHLPVSVDELEGQCIDIFHKNPAGPRRILSDPANLPYAVTIGLGDDLLALEAAAIHDSEGNYEAPMISWRVITQEVTLARSVSDVVDVIASAATELQATAEQLATNATDTSGKSGAVAAACEELGASIREIGTQVQRAADITGNAVNEAKQSSELLNGLADSVGQIGDFVKTIQEIASQTNMLALNATIEAARAGEAGKGFAVVAEVKALANQTANATDQITRQIATVRGSTEAAVKAIGDVSETITTINEVTTAISSAVEEQSAATMEVNSNVVAVSESTDDTGRMSSELEKAAAELAQQSEAVKQKVQDFMEHCRLAG